MSKQKERCSSEESQEVALEKTLQLFWSAHEVIRKFHESTLHSHSSFSAMDLARVMRAYHKARALAGEMQTIWEEHPRWLSESMRQRIHHAIGDCQSENCQFDGRGCGS